MFSRKYTCGQRNVEISKNHNLGGKDQDENDNETKTASLKFASYVRKRRRNHITDTENQKVSVPVDKDGTKEIKRYQRRDKEKKPDMPNKSSVELKHYKRREKGNKLGESTKSSEINTVEIKQYKRREKVKKLITHAKICFSSCMLDEEIPQLKDAEILDNYQNAPERTIQKENHRTNNICAEKNLMPCDSYEEKDKNVEMVPVLVNCSVPVLRERKLLILDINGLLADIRQENHVAKKADFKVNGKPAFKRPFCDDFLKFCFENFKVAIWSSRKKENVNKAVNFLLGDLKDNLLFCWDLSKCTKTGFKTLENRYKFVVLKDLKRIWDKSESEHNFEKGEFLPSNTLLLDDSPYKSLSNPPYTAIFPDPYDYEDTEDNFLGPGGNLRSYLEKLIKFDDVQSFVRDHPFGQPAISQAHPSWDFYYQIIQEVEKNSLGEMNCLVNS